MSDKLKGWRQINDYILSERRKGRFNKSYTFNNIICHIDGQTIIGVPENYNELADLEENSSENHHFIDTKFNQTTMIKNTLFFIPLGVERVCIFNKFNERKEYFLLAELMRPYQLISGSRGKLRYGITESTHPELIIKDDKTNVVLAVFPLKPVPEKET